MVRKPLGELALGDLHLELSKNLVYSQDERKIEEGIEMLESIVDSRLGQGVIKEDLNHEDIFDSMDALATAYRKRGRIAEAADIRQSLLSAHIEAYDKDDPRICISLDNMANVMLGMNKVREAYCSSKQSLDSRTKMYGKEHLITLHSMFQLAGVLYQWAEIDATKHQEAYEFSRHAMDLHRKVLGDRDEKTMLLMWNVLNFLIDQDKDDEAEDLIRLLTNQETAIYGPEDYITTQTMMLHARLLFSSGNYSKAEAVLTKLCGMVLAEWSNVEKEELFALSIVVLTMLRKYEEVIKIQRLRIPVKIELATKAPSRRHSWPSVDVLLSVQDEDEEDEEDEEEEEDDRK